MERVTKELLTKLHRYGHYDEERLLSPISIATLAGSLFLLAEAVTSLVHRWDDVHRRFLAIEDINIWFCVSVVRLYLTFFKKYFRIVDAIGEPFRGGGLDSRRKRALAESHSKTAADQLAFFLYTTRVINVNAILIPCLISAYRLYRFGNEFTVRDVVLPFEFYHTGTASMLGPVLLFQIVFSKSAIDGGQIVCLTLLGVVRRAVLDIRLLIVSIEEMDDRVSRSSSEVHYEERLKRQVSEIISHHADICKRIVTCNKHGSFFVLMGLQSICGQLCLLFYWLVEVDDRIILKIIDGTQALLFIAFTFLYTSLSQSITDEGENLKNKLYRCSWVNKPIWFKKSLLLMLTRANQSFEMQPYGLYTVSLRKFTAVVNASYSYFNLLRTFKNI